MKLVYLLKFAFLKVSFPPISETSIYVCIQKFEICRPHWVQRLVNCPKSEIGFSTNIVPVCIITLFSQYRAQHNLSSLSLNLHFYFKALLLRWRWWGNISINYFMWHVIFSLVNDTFPINGNKKIQNYLESCHRFCVFTRSRKRKVKKS